MPQSAEDAVAVVEQRRIDALIASDINALDEMIDEHCTHIESNGTSRTKATFLADVAKREFSFDLFEIEENYLSIHLCTEQGQTRRENGILMADWEGRHLCSLFLLSCGHLPPDLGYVASFLFSHGENGHGCGLEIGP